MKKILVLLLSLLFVMGCSKGNAFEQLLAVYENATEDMNNAVSMEDIHAIAKDIDVQIKAIEESPEFKEMQSLNESEEVVLEKYGEDFNAVIAVALEFETATRDAIKRIAGEMKK